jgi:hypothetical protein
LLALGLLSLDFDPESFAVSEEAPLSDLSELPLPELDAPLR